MFTYVDSRFFPWNFSRNGAPELLRTPSSLVNVSEAKRCLASHAHQVVDMSIAAYDYAPGGVILTLPSGETRPISPAKVPTADPFLPIVLAFVPTERDEAGDVVWRVELIDGAHRAAHAILGGVSSMPTVMLGFRASLSCVRPTPGFRGSISPQTFTETLFPGQPAHSCVQDAESHIGSRVPFSIETAV